MMKQKLFFTCEDIHCQTTVLTFSKRKKDKTNYPNDSNHKRT